MKKIIPIIFCLVLINFALLSAISYPHGFYGTAKFRSGGNVPDGYVVTGEVNGVITDSCEVVDGKYDLVVVDENDGGEIKFYIQGKEADQTSIFKTFEVTELNLTIESNLNFDDDFCGDGSCNNGETCSSCSIDCVCTSSTSGGNNGGSSGGSSTKSASNEITKSTDNDTDNSNPKTIEELNDDSENQESYSSKIQGAFIGFAKSPGGIVSIVFLIALTGAFVFFIFKRKSMKKNSKEEEIDG